MTETIFAVATPAGRGGVAMVRVSGPGGAACVQQLHAAPLPPPRIAALRTLKHPKSGVMIDRALVLFFPGPASFTGEDVAEFHLHGGRAVTDALLDGLAGLKDFRLAEPGEFTRRAFENGRMDLTAAEAVADLIDAETEAQKNQALAQMGGVLAALYDGWREKLTRSLAHLEADIDFPDEDLPGGVAELVRPELQHLYAEMRAHLDDNRRGERLRDGIHIAVIGAPNAGKSSLVNALAKREVAIVSEEAGTTRDIIEVHLNLGGYPVILSDTAGLRPGQIGHTGQDAIESEGIRRALSRAEEADIRVLLFDAESLPVLDPHTLALVNAASLVVFNKSDSAAHKPPRLPEHEAISVSVKKDTGLDKLTGALIAQIKALVGDRNTPSLTRHRHREALEQSAVSLERALKGKEAELIAEDIRLAMRNLGRITGRVDVEDLLDVIFRDFCIGK